MSNSELYQAREELINRLDERAMSEWPVELITAVCGVIDLHYGPPQAKPSRPDLKIIVGGSA